VRSTRRWLRRRGLEKWRPLFRFAGGRRPREREREILGERGPLIKREGTKAPRYFGLLLLVCTPERRFCSESLPFFRRSSAEAAYITAGRRRVVCLFSLSRVRARFVFSFIFQTETIRGRALSIAYDTRAHVRIDPPDGPATVFFFPPPSGFLAKYKTNFADVRTSSHAFNSSRSDRPFACRFFVVPDVGIALG